MNPTLLEDKNYCVIGFIRKRENTNRANATDDLYIYEIVDAATGEVYKTNLWNNKKIERTIHDKDGQPYDQIHISRKFDLFINDIYQEYKVRNGYVKELSFFTKKNKDIVTLSEIIEAKDKINEIIHQNINNKINNIHNTGETLTIEDIRRDYK